MESNEARNARMKQEHFDKYEAMAQKIGLSLVCMAVPVGRTMIQSALMRGDEYLNTIPLATWDRAAYRVMKSGMSLAEGVCVLKHVAKHHIAGVSA